MREEPPEPNQRFFGTIGVRVQRSISIDGPLACAVVQEPTDHSGCSALRWYSFACRLRSSFRCRPTSRGPGNGILRAETGGRFWAQNAAERSEFGSQTALRLANLPELRGFLLTRKPRRFAGTLWWAMQGSN